MAYCLADGLGYGVVRLYKAYYRQVIVSAVEGDILQDLLNVQETSVDGKRRSATSSIVGKELILSYASFVT